MVVTHSSSDAAFFAERSSFANSAELWQDCSQNFLQFLAGHSRVGLCLLDSLGNLLQCNQGLANLLKRRVLPAKSQFVAWLSENTKSVWTEQLEQFQATSSSEDFVKKSVRLTLMGRMKSQQDCVCHIHQLPRHKLLLVLEPLQESNEAVETISKLNNNLSNLTRELAQKNKILEETNKTIERLMNTDPLTGLANRRSINTELSHHYSLAKRQGVPLTVILCDLDKFKEVNDTYGHDGGDEVLVAFGKMLEECSRLEDRVARWGGEEFLVMLPMTDAEGAATLAERIREETSKLKFSLVPRKQTVSLGIAELHSIETVDSLIKRADQALYEAKSSGRDRFCLASQKELDAVVSKSESEES